MQRIQAVLAALLLFFVASTIVAPTAQPARAQVFTYGLEWGASESAIIDTLLTNGFKLSSADEDLSFIRMTKQGFISIRYSFGDEGLSGVDVSLAYQDPSLIQKRYISLKKDLEKHFGKPNWNNDTSTMGLSTGWRWERESEVEVLTVSTWERLYSVKIAHRIITDL